MFTLNLKGDVILYIAKARTNKSYIWVCSKSKGEVFLYIAEAHTHTKYFLLNVKYLKNKYIKSILSNKYFVILLKYQVISTPLEFLLKYKYK